MTDEAKTVVYFGVRRKSGKLTQETLLAQETQTFWESWLGTDRLARSRGLPPQHQP